MDTDADILTAATEKFEDLIAAGVIDPAKVTCYALQNAASIACLMLTTEAMIADVQEERAKAAAWRHGYGNVSSSYGRRLS